MAILNGTGTRLSALALLGLAWSVVGTACSPLHDLATLSKNYGSGGKSDGGAASGGGPSGGEGGLVPMSCGDGVVTGTEACDSGGVQAKDCEANCVRPVCGDGIVNKLAGEKCDTSGSTPACYRCDGSDPPCPANCTCVNDSGHRYAFCDTPKVASEARSICQSAGFDLVSIENPIEEGFVIGRSMDRYWPEVWLGGSDDLTEGSWRWLNSDQLFFTGVSPSGMTPAGAYSNFTTAEPNDTNQSQNFLIYGAQNGGWLDASATEVRSFVCELNPVVPDGCGNGKLDQGEACDGKGVTADCDSDCTASKCGDGVTNIEAGEACDDGNGDDLDGCSQCQETGLLVHYPLSEQRGSIAYDRGLFGINAKIYGGANVLDQSEGATFYSPSYAKFGSSKLEFSDFTISFGLKSNAWSGGLYYVTRDEGGLSSFHARITGTEFEVYSLDETAKRHPTALRLQGSAGENGNGSAFVHFAYTCESGHWIAYRQGIAVSSEDDPDGLCRAPKGATNFVLGSDVGGITSFLTGYLKEFRLYNRALTATEIATLNVKVATP